MKIKLKKLPIGASDFKVLKEEKYLYIDKTKEVIEFFDIGSKIILMPRPRRFGKTLFQSTLYYFFSNKVKDEEIFKDTYIYKTPFFKEHFGKYPVIFLTFKDLREPTFERLMENIGGLIDGIFSDYKHIDLDKLKGVKNEYKKVFKNIINDQATQVDYEK